MSFLRLPLELIDQIFTLCVLQEPNRGLLPLRLTSRALQTLALRRHTYAIWLKGDESIRSFAGYLKEDRWKSDLAFSVPLTAHIAISDVASLCATANGHSDTTLRDLLAILCILSPSLKSLVALDIRFRRYRPSAQHLRFPKLEYLSVRWSSHLIEALEGSSLSDLRWLLTDGPQKHDGAGKLVDILTTVPSVRHLRLELLELPAKLPQPPPATMSTIIIDAGEWQPRAIGRLKMSGGLSISGKIVAEGRITPSTRTENLQSYDERMQKYREFAEHGVVGELRTWRYACQSSEAGHKNQLIEAWKDWMEGGKAWLEEGWTPVPVAERDVTSAMHTSSLSG